MRMRWWSMGRGQWGYGSHARGLGRWARTRKRSATARLQVLGRGSCPCMPLAPELFPPNRHMRPRRWPMVPRSVVAQVVALALFAGSARAGLVCREPCFAAGQQRTGVVLRHRFVLVNQGKQPIHVVEVK